MDPAPAGRIEAVCTIKDQGQLPGLERLSSQRSEYTCQVREPEIGKLQLMGHGVSSMGSYHS